MGQRQKKFQQQGQVGARDPREVLRGVGLFGVVVFVALCRTEPSVRAAAMGVVALAALGALGALVVVVGVYVAGQSRVGHVVWTSG